MERARFIISKKTALLSILGIFLICSIAAVPAAEGGMGKVITIPPAGFTPDRTAVDDFYIEADEPSVYFELFGSDRGCVHAAVVFPKKAKKIKKVFIFIQDNSPADDAFFKMMRVDMSSGTGKNLGGFNTADAIGVVKYEIPINPKKVSGEYSYEIDGCLDQNIRVYGAQIKYQE
jgi:hypothetical protein